MALILQIRRHSGIDFFSGEEDSIFK